MRVRRAVNVHAVALFLCATGTTGALAQDNEQAVRQVVADFHAALAAGDSVSALGLLHPDVRIYEGGHAETREQYRSGHIRGDIAFLQAIESETTWEQVVLDGDLAIYMSEDRKTGTYRDREIDSHGTETIALVRTPDGWRIRHIHWSSR